MAEMDGPARRALSGAAPSSLHVSLAAQARDQIESIDIPHEYLGVAPGATVSQCQFAPPALLSQQRIEVLEGLDEPFATRDGKTPVRAGDYALSVRANETLQLHGMHARASLVADALKFIVGPAAGIGALGAVFLQISGADYGWGVSAVVTAPLALLVILAAYFAFLVGRGATPGTFPATRHVHADSSAGEVADIRQYYLHASEAIRALHRSRAWHSEVLAGPRVQINLDEEAAQLGDFALTLERLYATLGERPVQLGAGPLSLWESRQQIYRDGVASLASRAEALVALRLAVADVETRLHQLEQLHSPEAESLAARVVRSMPANEIAAAHTQNLVANAAGVAQALRDELTMLTATADEFARAAAQIPQFIDDERR